MNVCVIPARGGSKRLPGKNIKPFFGRPVILYAIETAKASGLFDAIYVTSNDRTTLHLVSEHGALMHYTEAHTDTSIDYDIITTVLKSVNADYLCYLYPVTPLLEVRDLLMGYDMMLSNLWNVVWATGPHGEEAGAFYWLDCRADVSEDRYYNDHASYKLGEFHYHDVNTLDDWRVMGAKYAVKWSCATL